MTISAPGGLYDVHFVREGRSHLQGRSDRARIFGVWSSDHPDARPLAAWPNDPDGWKAACAHFEELEPVWTRIAPPRTATWEPGRCGACGATAATAASVCPACGRELARDPHAPLPGGTDPAQAFLDTPPLFELPVDFRELVRGHGPKLQPGRLHFGRLVVTSGRATLYENVAPRGGVPQLAHFATVGLSRDYFTACRPAVLRELAELEARRRAEQPKTDELRVVLAHHVCRTGFPMLKSVRLVRRGDRSKYGMHLVELTVAWVEEHWKLDGGDATSHRVVDGDVKTVRGITMYGRFDAPEQRENADACRAYLEQCAATLR